MSIVLKHNDFNYSNVFFIDSVKTTNRFNSTFSRINYATDLMTLKTICINVSDELCKIENDILNKYLLYKTYNKPHLGYNLKQSYSLQDTGQDTFLTIKISGIWENHDGTFGLTYKTF